MNDPGAAGPSSARLSFEVPPDRSRQFAEVFGDQLRPLLQRHDLVAAAEPDPSVTEGVCSYLFEVASPAAVEAKGRALRRDPQWQASLRSLGRQFSAGRGDTALKYHWGICRSPAGPGRSAMAGHGARKGAWQGFGVRDGLPSAVVTAAFRDHVFFL